MIGKTLGSYEIIEQIGAGGMGEVYRARDTRLDRTVAIKVLPTELAGEPQFRQRFEREARAISNLSHPNICTLHDIGQENGVHYIVMEHLEGESLDKRLKKGPMELDELLKTATEIADALDKAHRQGVVHRDLKPGNVMLTKEGAKLLDFGLAKSEASPDAGDLTTTPTVTSPLTAEGTIVGTYQYMAPEQIEGQEVDARSDIFAFGAMLYEMATGKKAFEGRTQASLLASILKETPRPVAELQPLTPPALERLIKVCLEKEPDDRPHSAHDLMLQLRWIREGGSQAGLPAAVRTRRKSRERIAWIAAAVLLVVAAVLGKGLLDATSREPRVVRAFIPAPEGGAFDTDDTNPGPASISPDGRLIAFVVDEVGDEQLWVRPVDSHIAHPLSGTEGAAYPFWSPDGRTIGFFADRKLRKIDAGGGPPLTLCDAYYGKGGTWNEDGVIVFAPSYDTGLHRVAAAGGESVAVTELDSLRGDNSHRFPQFLPDGRHFLYLARGHAGGEDAEGAIFVRSLEDGEETMLMAAQSHATFASGHLLFVREHTLMARKFDHKSLEFKGDAFPLAEQVEYLGGAVYGAFSASKEGVLLYQLDRDEPVSQLTWVDRRGLPTGTVGTPGIFESIEISPDGSAIAAQMSEGSEFPDIWMIDVERGVKTRFTFDPATDSNPIWSPDASRIVFSSNRSGKFNLYTKTAGGAENEAVLLETDQNKFPTDWSQDGQYILYQGQGDIWALPTTGGQEPFPVVQTEFTEWGGMFSPDGRWLLYQSTESGKAEVYAIPFPGPGRKWQISTAGGTGGSWIGDEIFYVSADNKVMAVGVEAAGGALRVGPPEELFKWDETMTDGDVSRQGALLLAIMVEAMQPAPLVLVVNWSEELEDR